MVVKRHILIRGGGNMPRQKNKKDHYLKTASIGIVASILLLFALSFFNDVVSGEVFLHDALPHYGQIRALTAEDFMPAYAEQNTTLATSGVTVVGMNDVGVDFSTNYANLQEVLDSLDPHILHMPNIEDMRNPQTLKNTLYTVNNLTLFVPELFDVDAFVEFDARANPISIALGAPVVLIFHSHSTEMFIDSDPNDKFSGIVGVGRYLTDLLNERGIPTLHYVRRFDMVDGASRILGAYERQEAYIRQILADNPSIEVIIDMHRDGLLETAPRLVTEIGGKQTARLMFVNGLSTRNVNGIATPISYLPNPNLQGNLAFSFQLQMLLNETHPGLNRRIFLNAFRYSTHFLPKSVLLEVGDQRNTQREAKNAMYPFADALESLLR